MKKITTKRILLFAAGMWLLSTNARADKTTTLCPVIPGQSVNIKEATAKHMYADYKGQRYFFCCVSCPEAFRKNPAKYAKGGKTAKNSRKTAQGHSGH